MDCRAEIKKGSGSIDDVIRGYAAQSPEERLEEKTTGGNILDGVMRKYEEVLEKEYNTGELDDYLKSITDILTPHQINSFLQATISKEQHENYQENTGHFISRLIQNSYNAGHNDFTLNTTNLKPIHLIGFKLKGKSRNKIRITTRGNAGDQWGQQSENCEYNIQGNTEQIAALSRNCECNIQGNIIEPCGWGSQHSTYKTNIPETLEKMKRTVPKGNRIIFIHPDGTEETVRKYADKL